MSLFVEYEASRKVKSIFYDWNYLNLESIEKSLYLLESVLEIDGLFKTSVEVSDIIHRTNLTQTMLELIDFKTGIITDIFYHNIGYKFPEKIYEGFSRYPYWVMRSRLISNSHIPLELLREISEKEYDSDVRALANTRLSEMMENPTITN
jgi:hypothetical protein